MFLTPRCGEKLSIQGIFSMDRGNNDCTSTSPSGSKVVRFSKGWCGGGAVVVRSVVQ